MTDLDTLYAQRKAAMAESHRWAQEMLRLRNLYVRADDVPAVQRALDRATRLHDLASSGAAKLTLKIAARKGHGE